MPGASKKHWREILHVTRNTGAFDKAQGMLDSVWDSALLDSDSVTMGWVHTERGTLSLYQNKYADALLHLQSGLRLFETLEDTIGIAESLNGIASVHFYLEDYDLAKENYLRAASLRETKNTDRELAVSYNNLGIVYTQMGLKDSALVYQWKSLEIWESLKNLSGIAVTKSHIGNCFREKGNYEVALVNLLESHQIQKQQKKQTRAWLNIEPDIGLTYLAMNQIPEALKWCESGYEQSENGQALFARQQSCYCLYKIYQAKNRPDKALGYYEEYVVLKDSLQGPQMAKEVTRLELNYAFEKIQEADSLRFESERSAREQQIRTQRTTLLSMGVVLLLIGMLGLSVYRGKKRSDVLLLNILPKKTAEELKKDGKAKARYYHEVTVMFADFVNFTEATESYPPGELVDAIHHYFSAFDTIMEKYDIEKIKTIGDSYMAVSGLPGENAAHARNMILAAKEIIRFVEEQRSNSTAGNDIRFDIRIGIHSGPVIAGIVGRKKFQYDIWGDTVNTASRLETASMPGRINLSEKTFDLIKEEFNCEPRGKIHAKGKGDMEMYFLAGHR
jgi:adenylate cyclase